MAPQMPKTKQQRQKETNSNKKTTTTTTHQHKMRTKSFDVKTRKSFSPYRMHLEISRFDNFSCNKRTVYCFRYWFHSGIVEPDRVGSGVQCACCSIVLTLVDSFQSQRQTTRLDYLPECVIIFDFSFVFLLLSRSFGVLNSAHRFGPKWFLSPVEMYWKVWVLFDCMLNAVYINVGQCKG